MKRNFLIIGVLVIFSLSFWSCEDLDTNPQGNIITSLQKEEVYDLDPAKAEAGVVAIFTQFSTYGINTSSNNLRHNDIGYPTLMIFTDMDGHNMVSANVGYNWFAGGLTYEDRPYNYYPPLFFWNNLYRITSKANDVIAGIPRDVDDEFSKFSLAQGLAARGFSYLIMAQLYQFNYVGHENDPSVLIITDENRDDIALAGGAPRAKLQEVYDLVMDDLNTAIELLTDNPTKRVDKRFIDLATAYGIRARANLAMHKYPEAASDATNAINVSTAVPAGLTDVNKPSFWDSSEKNWMWGIVIAETDRVVTSGIVNWISHMGSFSGNGYNTVNEGFQISKKLFNTIPATDIRRGWWTDGTGVSANLTPEQQAFIDKLKFKPYTQVKFAPYNDEVGTTLNANDIPLMRIEEMYLIKAEAEQMSSGNGVATLTDFVSTYRDPSYTYSATNFQDEIYRQRSIELWGEGLNWYDNMRLGITIDRRGAGYPNPTVIFVIEPDDPIRLWRIPQSEIEANNFLTDADNNPAVPLPTPVPDEE